MTLRPFCISAKIALVLATAAFLQPAVHAATVYTFADGTELTVVANAHNVWYIQDSDGYGYSAISYDDAYAVIEAAIYGGPALASVASNDGGFTDVDSRGPAQSVIPGSAVVTTDAAFEEIGGDETAPTTSVPGDFLADVEFGGWPHALESWSPGVEDL